MLVYNFIYKCLFIILSRGACFCIVRLIGHMEEGAFSSDEELTLMLLNNLRMMMQPLDLEANGRDGSLCIPQAIHLRNKLLKRYFSAEQATVAQYEEDILRELLCYNANLSSHPLTLNVF